MQDMILVRYIDTLVHWYKLLYSIHWYIGTKIKVLSSVMIMVNVYINVVDD